MLYCFRERELILNINEMIAGFRMFPSYIRVGGLREDLPRGFHAAVNSLLERLPGKISDYEDLLTKNTIFLNRAQGVGTFNLEQCYQYGLVGPLARAAGSTYDVRKAFPYAGYDTFEFDVPTREHGDVYDRYLVRVEEIRQSVRICRQAIERITPTDAYVPIEGPRGEHGAYVVSDGTNRPARVHLRPASFYACQAMPPMVVGGLLADVVAVIGSTDIVMGDVDR